MADSYLEVTPGSGLKLRTNTNSIGGSTVHDQFLAVAEPSMASYFIDPGNVASTATPNSHLLEIRAGASLNVYVRRIVMAQVTLAGALAQLNVSILRLSTAGTGGTSGGYYPADTTDPSTPGFTTMVIPSSKGTEGGTLWFAQVVLLAALPTVPNPRGLDLYEWDFEKLRGKALRIPAGTANGICVKNTTGVATAAVTFSCEIAEANF